MDTSQENGTHQHAAPVTYACISATVEGLPSRGIFKSEGKYYIALAIDGRETLRSAEARTRGKKVSWTWGEKSESFTCDMTSSLRIALWKNHSVRAAEEVGSVELALTDWLAPKNPMILTLHSHSKVKADISVCPSLIRMGESSTDTKDPSDEVEQAVEQAVADVAVLPLLVNGGKTAEAHDATGESVDSAVNSTEIWNSLLQNVDWLVETMDIMSEVHPYAKMAWSVLSAAYKLVKAQSHRDANVLSLVDTMRDVYAFIREVSQTSEIDAIMDQTRKGNIREMALKRLSCQTVECAHFISAYAKDSTFLMRLATNSLSGTNNLIKGYKNTFEQFKQDFRDGSQLRMEVVTYRMVADLQTLGGNLDELRTKFDIQQIPYSVDAGNDPDKCCLPGTRTALLQDIISWVTAENVDASRLFILMGPAGTGKSAIAHTIASQFEATDQLASMFCFSVSERATREPASLFRNIARDMCKGHKAFQAALAKSVGNDMNTCGTKNLDRQFDKFLLAPANMIEVTGTMLFVIDGLDESGTERERAKLLSVLLKRLRELPASFRFLVTCRTEPDIVHPVLQKSAGVHYHVMPTADQEPSLPNDILQYVRHKLSRGSETLPDRLDDKCCQALTSRAEGLFQWAFVACDYINGEQNFGETEHMRYKKLMAGTRAVAGLDQLYRTVLKNLIQKNEDALQPFKIAMGFVLTAVEPMTRRSLRHLMTRLPAEESVDPETFEKDTILPLLGSLLSGVAGEDAPVRPLHSSFAEMLCDPDRGEIYYIGATGHHERLTVASLQLLKDVLHFNMANIETSHVLLRDIIATNSTTLNMPESLVYACKQWGYHLARCELGFESGDNLKALVRALFKENLLCWIEAASVMRILGDLSGCLETAKERIALIDDDVLVLATESQRFLRRFGPVISESPPHLYLSALTWCPTDSKLYKIYRWHCITLRPIAGQMASWPPVEFVVSGHTQPVISVAFSPDGKHIVSASDGDTIRLWDAETGQLVHGLLSETSSGFLSVAFSPDSKRIVSASEDGSIRLWNAETAEVIGEPSLGYEMGAVCSVAFSHDGKRLVSGASDNSVRIWDVDSGDLLVDPLFGHTAAVKSVAISPDGRRIASASEDNKLCVWNSHTGEPVLDSLEPHAASVNSVAYSPDSRWIVTGSSDRSIRLWDAESGTVEKRAPMAHNWPINSVAFLPDGKHIVSGSNDQTLRVWDATTLKAVGEPLTGHVGAVHSVSVSQDGKRIVSGSADTTIRVWRADTGLDSHELAIGHTRTIFSVAISPDGRRIISCSNDRTIWIWDATTGSPLLQTPIMGHTDAVKSVAISPDGTRIISGSADTHVRIWDAETGSPLGEGLARHSGVVNAVIFSPDGSRFASASSDGTVLLWDTNTQEIVCNPMSAGSDAMNAIAFSPDGLRLASGSADCCIRIWDTTSGNLIGEPWKGHSRAVRAVAFSPDGEYLVSGADDDTVRLWFAVPGQVTGTPLFILQGHVDAVRAVDFSPNGEYVVSAGNDNKIRVWNASTGELAGYPLRGHKAEVPTVKFTPDGKHIVSGSLDRTIRVWNANSMGAISRAAKTPAGKRSAAIERATLIQIERLEQEVEDWDNGVKRSAVSGESEWKKRALKERIAKLKRGELDEVTASLKTVTEEVQVVEQPNETVSNESARAQHTPEDQSAVPPLRDESDSDLLQTPTSADVVLGEEDVLGEDVMKLPYPCFSPHLRHSLGWPKSVNEKPLDLVLNFRTGWIIANGTDYLFWVPPDMTHRLYTGQLEVAIPGPTIHIDLRHFYHGKGWTKWCAFARERTREHERERLQELWR